MPETKELLEELVAEAKGLKEEQRKRLDEIELRFQRMSLEHRPADNRSASPFASLEQKVDFKSFEHPTDWEPRNVRLGALLLGIAGGQKVVQHLHDDEVKALFESSGPAGGYIVPGAVIGEFIESVRPACQVMKAGARTVEMRDGPTLALPGFGSPLPTASWRAGEGVAYADAGATFRAVILNARSVGSFLTVSQEMLDDAAGSIGTVSALLEAELGKAIAVAIDQAALIGTGVGGQPMGLYNTPGVSQTLLTSPNGSTLANYQFLITAVGVVRSGNFEPSAVIYDARTDKQLNSLVTGIAGDLRQLAIPEPIASMPRLVTNQIGDAMTCGTSSDCSAAFVGDYSQLVVGVRPSLGVRVLVDPYTTASTGQIRLFAWTRCDVGVLNTSAFAVVSGLRA